MLTPGAPPLYRPGTEVEEPASGTLVLHQAMHVERSWHPDERRVHQLCDGAIPWKLEVWMTQGIDEWFDSHAKMGMVILIVRKENMQRCWFSSSCRSASMRLPSAPPGYHGRHMIGLRVRMAACQRCSAVLGS